MLYAYTFSTLTGAAQGAKDSLGSIGEGINTMQGLESMLDTTINNLPFFAVVNTVYARGVEYATRRFGRVGANALCLGVNGAFALYAYLTGEQDPALQTAAITAVGLYLTNVQASEVLAQESESEKRE